MTCQDKLSAQLFVDVSIRSVKVIQSLSEYVKSYQDDAIAVRNLFSKVRTEFDQAVQSLAPKVAEVVEENVKPTSKGKSTKRTKK